MYKLLHLEGFINKIIEALKPRNGRHHHRVSEREWLCTCLVERVVGQTPLLNSPTGDKCLSQEVAVDVPHSLRGQLM